MSKIEQENYVKVNLSPKNPFEMTFLTKDKNKSLSVENPKNFGEKVSMEAQDLTRTLILSHLIIRHFPKNIETNFNLEHSIFLNSLYQHYGLNSPRIIKNPDQIKIKKISDNTNQEKEKYLSANAHSGGLDSLYRAAKFLSENKKFIITHVKNLNHKGGYREAMASKTQAIALGSPYQEILLRNGSDNTGFATMRTRDMFLALLVAVSGAQHGIKNVYIEGDMQNEKKSHFSEYSPAWDFFNNLLTTVGLPTIKGIDAHDIETVAELIKLESNLNINLLSLVQNCFSASYQLPNIRKKWETATPQIAENSPSNWCGSCLKCRRMTLGRIYYHDPKFQNLTQEEINFFTNDTYKWLKNYSHNQDLISDNFIRHLDNLKNQR